MLEYEDYKPTDNRQKFTSINTVFWDDLKTLLIEIKC